MQFLKAAPIQVGPRPIMIFGMGSHTHPGSRNSVGYFLVNLLGKRLKTPFHRFTSCNAYVAHFAPENLLLVQPDTYFVIDNHQCMRRIVHHYPVEPTKSVLIYHEPSLPLGTVEYMTKGRTEHNSDLHKLATELKTEEFPRIAVGIEYPTPNTRFDPPLIHQMQNQKAQFEELFLLNKFPYAHWVELHETVLPKVFAAVDKAVGDIREEFPLTNVDEDPLRPESNWATHTENDNPPHIHFGPKEDVQSSPQQPQQQRTTAEEQHARLWAIRRQRENDPEFAKLISGKRR